MADFAAAGAVRGLICKQRLNHRPDERESRAAHVMRRHALPILTALLCLAATGADGEGADGESRHAPRSESFRATSSPAPSPPAPSPPAPSSPAPSSPAPSPASAAASGEVTLGSHAVEFRARAGPDFLGHSYIAFGRIAPDGSFIEEHTAGLYPKDGIGGYVTGLTGTESTIDPVPLDELIPPALTYRRRISPDQYARLVAAVDAARRSPPPWSWTGYNCNTFVAEIAATLGLEVPPGATFFVPILLVAELRRLNGD